MCIKGKQEILSGKVVRYADGSQSQDQPHVKIMHLHEMTKWKATYLFCLASLLLTHSRI